MTWWCSLFTLFSHRKKVTGLIWGLSSFLCGVFTVSLCKFFVDFCPQIDMLHNHPQP